MTFYSAGDNSNMKESECKFMLDLASRNFPETLMEFWTDLLSFGRPKKMWASGLNRIENFTDLDHNSKKINNREMLFCHHVAIECGRGCLYGC